GLQTAKTPYVVTAPCDAPLIPDDLVHRLYSTLQDEDAEICTAFSNGRLQPVFTLMKSELLSSMLDFLNNGERKIDMWFEKHHLAIVDFSDQAETFININSTEELAAIELKLKQE
ncbi:MAG: NTP transferase domain-containing protein, partial [Gammaproteobacteria bacterium]